MALELTLALLAFRFCIRPGQTKLSQTLFLLSGGTARGCIEDEDCDGGVDDVEDDEVLQLISLIDSRCRPEGSSGARYKTTGARAEARAVGTTQPVAPEVSFGHLGHSFAGAFKSEGWCNEAPLRFR